MQGNWWEAGYRIRKCGDGDPGFCRGDRYFWRNAEFSIPEPSVMGAYIPDIDDGMKPRPKGSVIKGKVVSDISPIAGAFEVAINLR